MRLFLNIELLCSLIFLAALLPDPVAAAESNFVTPVFPVRARAYWRQGSDIQQLRQLTDVVIKHNLPSTWLLHYDVLQDNEILSNLKSLSQSEYGLFLEVTRKLADDSFVRYDWEHGDWSQANKLFLSGYSREQRQRMIDTAFWAFQNEFGTYPASYGAWYIDVWSMEYIRDTYGANVVLGLADQYSTDGYQTWGQYLNLPYFVSIESAIEPAESALGSTHVLKLQWAPRHPLLAYGSTVDFSNYSLQVNDYHRQKKLGQAYFRALLLDITANVRGPISQAVVGIEAGELEAEYFSELSAQLSTLKELADKKVISNVTLQQFNSQYRKSYSAVSPDAVITSTVGNEKITWYLSAQRRYAIKDSGWKKYLVDLRYYHTSPYRDNDQLTPDSRPNLVRVAPAVVDDVVSANAQEINTDADVFSLFPDPVLQPSYPSDLYGQYSGKWPEAKDLWVKIVTKMPDLVYSNLEGQKYLGFRSGFEQLIGIRWPKLKIGRFDFKFPTLENFISLKRKFQPHFVWNGKQEIELEPHKPAGTVWAKGWNYGQDQILNRPAGRVVYENSFYAVIVNHD